MTQEGVNMKCANVTLPGKARLVLKPKSSLLETFWVLGSSHFFLLGIQNQGVIPAFGVRFRKSPSPPRRLETPSPRWSKRGSALLTGPLMKVR